MAPHFNLGEGRRVRAWSYPGGPGERTPAAAFGIAGLPVAEGAGLAHDAGNLLGALRLYCDLLARPGVLREEHRHYAEELQLLSQRSGTLVDRLLNPAETGRRERQDVKGGLDASSVSVPGVIEQCRGLLSTIARRAVEVVYGVGAETPVPVSREAVERILVNLTKNAAEASAAGGAITLRVSRLREPHRDRRSGAASRLVLSVEDQGCGMSVAAVKVLLTQSAAPARTLESETQGQQLHGLGLVPRAGTGMTSGRGLGFRVVRELVQASGGELRLKSESGCGTTVEIGWAVTDPAANDRIPGKSHSSSAASAELNGSDGVLGRVSC